jgi:lycopene cyclase domain-containing protein
MLILKTKVIKKRSFWVVMGFLVLLTAVFDQLLTGLPIVFYNEANISGIRLFYAPIEDFTYTIAVVILTGSLLHYEKSKSKN